MNIIKIQLSKLLLLCLKSLFSQLINVKEDKNVWYKYKQKVKYK